MKINGETRTKFDENPDVSVSSWDSLSLSFFSPMIWEQITFYLGDGSGQMCGFAGA